MYKFMFIDLSSSLESQKEAFLNSIKPYIIDWSVKFTEAVYKKDFIVFNSNLATWYHLSEKEVNSDLNTYYKNYKVFKLKEVQNVENFVDFLINEISSISDVPKEEINIKTNIHFVK